MRGMLWGLLSAFCFCLPFTIQAYPDRYGPFQPRQEPRSFPMQECTPSEPQANLREAKHIVYPSQGASSVRLQVDVTESHYITVVVTDSTGKPLSQKRRVMEDNPYGFLGEVHTADLNRDSKPDFVGWIWYGGCGLAAENALMVYALSSGNGYRIVTQDAMAPCAKDFVDLRQDGGCQIIHTDFIHGEAGKDGKSHNYWVYSVYEIVGTELRKANSLMKGFPKWVWYSHRENHAATDQLTEAQKQRLLGEAR